MSILINVTKSIFLLEDDHLKFSFNPFEVNSCHKLEKPVKSALIPLTIKLRRRITIDVVQRDQEKLGIELNSIFTSMPNSCNEYFIIDISIPNDIAASAEFYK